MCFDSCIYQNQNFFTRVALVSFVQHSCCTHVVRVTLMLHLCCTGVTRVSLVLHFCHILVARVCHSCCKLDQILRILQRRSIYEFFYNMSLQCHCMTKSLMSRLNLTCNTNLSLPSGMPVSGMICLLPKPSTDVLQRT